MLGNTATWTYAIDIAAIVEEWSDSVMLVENTTTKGEKSLGTAFVVDSSGLLVTNFHVIANNKSITVKTAGGDRYRDAKLVAVDRAHDLAVISVESEGLTAVKLADGSELKIGSDVIVIGNPRGLEQTVTEGIISATRQVGGIDVIQMSAAISSGSSGSPVFTADGTILGVATFKRVDGESLNFAIPSKHIEDLIKSANRNPDARPSAKIDDSIFTRSERSEDSAKQDAVFSESLLFKDLKSQELEGDYFAMLNGAKNAVEMHPESALAYRVLSDAFFYVDLYEDAVATAITAIDLDYENPRGWNNLGILFSWLGDIELERRVYNHAVSIAPNDAKILLEYSEIIVDDSPELAYSATTQAKRAILNGSGVDLETVDYDLEWETILSFLNLGKEEDAWSAARAFKVKSPEKSLSWVNLGYAAYYTDRLYGVQPSIQKAFELDKGLERDPDLLVLVGDAAFENNKTSVAYNYFNKALEINPLHLGALESKIYARLEDAVSAKWLAYEIEVEMWENLQKIQKIDRKLGKKIRADLKESGIEF